MDPNEILFPPPKKKSKPTAASWIAFFSAPVFLPSSHRVKLRDNIGVIFAKLKNVGSGEEDIESRQPSFSAPPHKKKTANKPCKGNRGFLFIFKQTVIWETAVKVPEIKAIGGGKSESQPASMSDARWRGRGTPIPPYPFTSAKGLRAVARASRQFLSTASALPGVWKRAPGGRRGGHGIITESPTTHEGTNPLDRTAVGGERGHGGPWGASEGRRTGHGDGAGIGWQLGWGFRGNQGSWVCLFAVRHSKKIAPDPAVHEFKGGPS